MEKESIFFKYLIASILLKITLEFSYSDFIHSYFFYQGFENNYNLGRHIASYFFLFVAVLLNCTKLNSGAGIFVLFINIFLYIPLTVLYVFIGIEYISIVVVLITMSFISMAQNLLPKVSFVSIKYGGSNLYFFGIYLITLLFCFYLISLMGMPNISEIGDVYTQREYSKTFTAGIISYLIPLVTKVMLPFYIIYFLLKKSITQAMFLIALYFIIAMILGQKAIIFYIVFYISSVYLMAKYGVLSFIYILLFMILSAMFIAYTYNELMPLSFAVRRLFFIPAYNTYIYFLFFEANEFVYWTNNIFSMIYTYPYSDSIPNVIGNYKGTESHVNSGFLSTGYANAGWLGVLIYGFSVMVMVPLLATIRMDSREGQIAFAPMFMPLLSIIISSDLVVSLLSHGLLFGLFVSLLYYTKNRKFN